MSAKKILIVEDDSDVALAYHILLKAKHYETFFAKDPFSCLWQAHRNRPDGILMDLGLAAGDGFRAIEQLKIATHLADIPIIVISCRDPRDFADRALQVGARAYLQKPFEHAQMLALVYQHIGESGGELSLADHSDIRRLAEASL